MKIAKAIKQKKEKELPEQAVCRNCGTKLISRYCHNCKQDFFWGSERSLGAIINNTFATLFAWDNKILITLKYLLFYPGKLTNEYFSGRIVRYVYPSKLFWFISLLFFAVSITVIDSKISKEIDSEFRITNSEEKNNEDKADKLVNIESDEDASIVRELINSIKRHTFSVLPYITFALIPFFALLLKLFFRNKKQFYANHIIFSLHFFAFTFIIFFLIFIRIYLLPNWRFVDILLASILLVYFIISIKKVYKPSIGEMIWKLPLFGIMYFVILIFILISLFIGIILFAFLNTTGDIF
ncbi:MAG: DUF3667 domain-containing protein [Lentimicrobiaceae bacterium]|jgi:hypothetical protein|nr:DUF3667 domain-containing protein [Lentimicrobiaceae bacterium]